MTLALLALLACGTDQRLKQTDTGADADADTDADTDTDADSDADTDTDTDTDTAPAPEITGITAHLIPDVASITTRETVTVVVVANWSDGSTTDMTAGSTITSSDRTVLDFFQHDVGQPLLRGSVTIDAVAPNGTDLAPIPLAVTMSTVAPGDLVFNELLVDPATTSDPNGDGDSDPVEDEFLEIANAADATVDLSGVTLWDADLSTARHTFPTPTYLRAGEVIVVFGGGDVSALSAPYATFVIADNEDVGLQHGIALNNEGDAPVLLGANGTTVLVSTPYGDSGGPTTVSDSSLVLAPEVYGTSYTAHVYATATIGAQSPGTHADGTPFPGPSGTY